MEKQIFKSLTNRMDIDLIPYVKNFVRTNENTVLYIGCDSQNIRNVTNYAIVIVLYNAGRGGHVLYTKISVPKISDRYVRLWSEVEYSVQAAE